MKPKDKTTKISDGTHKKLLSIKKHTGATIKWIIGEAVDKLYPFIDSKKD